MRNIGFGPKNYVGPAPVGSWTYTYAGNRFLVALVSWTTVSAILFFATVATYLQGGNGTAIMIFYTIIALSSAIVWMFERIGGKDINALAVIDVGYPQKWLLSLPLGFGIGVGTAFIVQNHVSASIPFESLGLFASLPPVVGFIGTILFIPFAEELFFSGIMTPSSSEVFGIIPGILMTSGLWMIWHLGTYPESFGIILILGAFRIVASTVTLYTKTIGFAILAHIIINTMAIVT